MITRKAIGFKSLWLKCWDITHVIQKGELSTNVSKILRYYLIQSYLLKWYIYYASPLMFTWEIYEFFKSSHYECFMKKLFLKLLQHSQESCRPATLLRTPILKNICNSCFWFSRYGTVMNSCFCNDNSIEIYQFVFH